MKVADGIDPVVCANKLPLAFMQKSRLRLGDRNVENGREGKMALSMRIGLLSAAFLLATPSTCAQFLPNSDEFAVDPRPPAYRTFELRADGSLLTEVVWVEQHCGGSSHSACSAA